MNTLFELEDAVKQAHLSYINAVYNLASYKAKAGAYEIEETDLTTRAKNILKYLGIVSLGQLSGFTEIEMIKIPNLGRKTLIELKDALRAEGLEFAHRQSVRVFDHNAERWEIFSYQTKQWEVMHPHEY